MHLVTLFFPQAGLNTLIIVIGVVLILHLS